MLPLTESERSFRLKYPAYEGTSTLDELRARDYPQLDAHRHVYLDYTGAGLYGASQLRAHHDLLLADVYGNPHSSNPTSMLANDLVDRARAGVLDYFEASADEYAVIFTPNATGALKLVGEAFPFRADSRLLLLFDNHNSVNGIREFARSAGASIAYVPVMPPDMHVDDAALARQLARAEAGAPKLFAYPAQSNFSGVQHPLEWIERARGSGWHVLLDAAAYVPTSRLDLSRHRPDFVSMSFYKMFGYPTGVGCLLARREALAALRRPWFSGGTISVASVQGDQHYLHEGSEAFEDGTINYLSLPAVTIGLAHLARAGRDTIRTRVSCLTGWLLDELNALRHRNGAPVVRIYGPLENARRGGTIAFNFHRHDGLHVDHREVERQANGFGISLRTGCFCNPGGGELALGITSEDLAACLTPAQRRLSLDDFRRCMDEQSTGAVRISLGIASNFADAWRFMEFARRFVDPLPA